MFISILLLVLLLGCAALASESIQEVVAQRISVLSSKGKYRSPGSAVLSEAFEEQAVCSYIMARTYQPQYIIARSVLISSTGFLVTLCIPFSIVASAKNGYIPENDGFDGARLISLVLQWSFILFGWLIICWRWITAVVYYPRRMDKKGTHLMAYFQVEDFWKRAMLELQEKFIQWDINSIKRLSFLNRNLFIFVHKLRLYKLLPAFLYLQILLVLMSKTCWLISEMIFSNRYMRRLLMGRASHEFSVLYNLYSNGQVGGPAIPKEFVKYLEDSMQMPGENPAGGWIANRKPIQKMKARLKEGESDGKNCKALISFLEKKTTQDLRFADPFGISFPKLLVESDFNVGKSSAKMIAVSLLAIIIELSGFYEAYDGSPATDDCIKACSEAWEIMELVENSDTEAAFVNKQADRLFHRLKE